MNEFDLDSAIVVREREDGLFEKDVFDLPSAVPVSEGNIANPIPAPAPEPEGEPKFILRAPRDREMLEQVRLKNEPAGVIWYKDKEGNWKKDYREARVRAFGQGIITGATGMKPETSTLEETFPGAGTTGKIVGGVLPYLIPYGGTIAKFALIPTAQEIARQITTPKEVLSIPQRFGKVGLAGAAGALTGVVFDKAGLGRTVLQRVAMRSGGAGIIRTVEELGQDLISGKAPNVKRALLSGINNAAVIAIVSGITEIKSLRSAIWQEARDILKEEGAKTYQDIGITKKPIKEIKTFAEAKELVAQRLLTDPEKLSPVFQEAMYKKSLEQANKNINAIAKYHNWNKEIVKQVRLERNQRQLLEAYYEWLYHYGKQQGIYSTAEYQAYQQRILNAADQNIRYEQWLENKQKFQPRDVVKFVDKKGFGLSGTVEAVEGNRIEINLGGRIVYATSEDLETISASEQAEAQLQAEAPVVYHGTNQTFEEFSEAFLGKSTGAPSASQGFFFATNPKVASGYASTTYQKLRQISDTIAEAKAKIKKLTGDDEIKASFKIQRNEYPEDIDKKVTKLLTTISRAEGSLAEYQDVGGFEDIEISKRGEVKAVKLDIKNPFIYDMQGKEYRERSFYDIIKEAKEKGHDSVIIKNTYDSVISSADELTDIHIVFDKSQIKPVAPEGKEAEAAAEAQKVGAPEEQEATPQEPTLSEFQSGTTNFSNVEDAEKFIKEVNAVGGNADITRVYANETADVSWYIPGGSGIKPPKEPPKTAVSGAPEEEPFESDIEKEPVEEIPEEDKLKVTSETIKPDKDNLTPLEKQFKKIEDRKIKIEILKDVLKEVNKQRKFLFHSISLRGFGKEEYRDIPRWYITRKRGASDVDEVISELESIGVFVRDLSDPHKTQEEPLVNYIKNLEKARKNILEEIEDLRMKMVTQREDTILMGKLKAFKSGVRKGAYQTKQEIKEAQSDLIKGINISGIPAQDKAKFINTIKNIQSRQDLGKIANDVIRRLRTYKEAEDKRKTAKVIKNELETTKPVKQGIKTAGRFDYETNKVFDEYRSFSRLNKTQAQEKFDELSKKESLDYIDLAKLRMLSLKANGAKSSAELFRQVLSDIRAIKQAGLEAKNEADFAKKLARAEKIEEMLDNIRRIKGNKKEVLTQITNWYRKGFTNIYSIINSIAGKKLAARYDPEAIEMDEVTAIYQKVKNATSAMSEILGAKDQAALLRHFQEMTSDTFTITDREGITKEITKMDIIDIYNALKNDKTRERHLRAFGKEQLDSLLSNLTPEELELGDLMQEQLEEYADVFNQRNIELYGKDNGFVENYWPATSEYLKSVIDDIRIQGELPSTMKDRSASMNVIPIATNAYFKMLKHITQGEHVRHLSRRYEELKRIFQDRKVKNAISNKFGEDVYYALMDRIDSISLNKVTERLDFVSDVLGKLINNWVVAKVAFNPSVFAKQLISIINYAEDMPVGAFAKHFFEGISGIGKIKETFKFMWDNSKGFLETRFNKGYNEALQEAIKGANAINVNKRNWAKGLSSFSRAGDITAIIYGGNALVKHLISEGKSLDEAFEIFKASTLKSQQSGMASGISQFQASKNPLARILLAFKNTANQYLRKQVDAILNYQNKEISAGKLAKITTIYSILNPLLYVLVGLGVVKAYQKIGESFGKKKKKDDSDIGTEIMIRLMTNPFEAIPLLDDISEYVARRALGKKTYQIFSLPMISDVERSLRTLGKKDITLMDYFETLGTATELATGAPIHTGLRIFKHIKGEDKKKGTTNYGGQKKSSTTTSRGIGRDRSFRRR